MLNKIDACFNPAIFHKLRIKYPKTVRISALTREGFEELLEKMTGEIQSLRKRVKLRVPQSHYAVVSELLREGRVISCDYEENDIVIDVEIPGRLEHKIKEYER